MSSIRKNIVKLRYQGTNADFRGKANEDYKKRSKDQDTSGPGKSRQKVDWPKITFVFVTPLVWKDKQDWADKKSAEGVWRNVTVIDGVDLQDWLETAPAVNLQFAAELGLAPEEGLQTPELAWKEWSLRSVPPASEGLVVAGRQEQEREFIERLSSPPGTFTVRGDLPREVLGEDLRANLHARTVVAENEGVAARLAHLKNLIVILKQPRGQVSGFLSSRNCHVVVPEGNDERSMGNVLVVPRPTHREFSEALAGMRLSEEEADQTSRACGRSVTILQRQRAPANVWTLTAPVDAFQLLAHRLTSANLARFKDAFRKVFGRIDSKVEIPPEKWIFHSQRLEG